MIIITDGVPTDDLESVIVSIAKKLDKADAPPYQVGIPWGAWSTLISQVLV